MKTKGSIHIGARTVKTALAVFLCMLLSWFIPHMEGIHSCISTIICMMPTAHETLKVGINRVMATIFACLAGAAVLLCYSLMPDWYYLARMILVPLFVILMISFCNLIQRREAILLCTTVFIVLALGPTMSLEGVVVYSIARFLETILGIAVAFVVNGVVRPQKVVVDDVAEIEMVDIRAPEMVETVEAEKAPINESEISNNDESNKTE